MPPERPERPSIDFRHPISEDRTLVDRTPWHQIESPLPPPTLPRPTERSTPSVPALASDAVEPTPPASPRLRTDWAALGATAVFLALSCLVIRAIDVDFTRPAAARPHEVKQKGYTPAHDPALRTRAVEIAAPTERRPTFTR